MIEQFIPSFVWRSPTRIVYGVDRIRRLPDEIREVAGGDAKVFLVTGRTFLRSRGILPQVLRDLRGFSVDLYDRARPFPSPDHADAAADACRNSGANVVVGIGGGSALDLAKAAAILATHTGRAREYALEDTRFDRPSLPLIAVPTTSGSSSEVTSGAALWDWDDQSVLGLGDPAMFPEVAIVDPRLAMTMSQTLAANTGMDALTSAFESYWNVHAEPMSDAIALEVIRCYSRNLVRSAIQGDLESRASCALAATMAGVGYSNSTPNACHAVGSPLTLYWNVEHGQSVAMTLVPFLRWNAQAISHKLGPLLAALEVHDLDGACSKLERIIKRSGLTTRLSGLGIQERAVDHIVERCRWDRFDQLPRPIEAPALRGLLMGIV